MCAKSYVLLARRMFTKAAELDPSYARAYAGIAILRFDPIPISTRSTISMSGSSSNRATSRKRPSCSSAPPKQIAADLSTVEKTIKVHRARIMEKMAARSLAELVRIADRLGIGPGSPRMPP
jgi:hypothetical protein